mmetsp:Transcript_140839/g.245198  ORF Transcript_140839/g.245198 Transcript_140839/m.245198 type:complete len:131 (+) Transcript_140839:143-535(+)
MADYDDNTTSNQHNTNNKNNQKLTNKDHKHRGNIHKHCNTGGCQRLPGTTRIFPVRWWPGSGDGGDCQLHWRFILRQLSGGHAVPGSEAAELVQQKLDFPEQCPGRKRRLSFLRLGSSRSSTEFPDQCPG